MISPPDETKGRCGRRGLPKALTDAMYADYLRLKSLAKVAALYGRTRQAMHDILARRQQTRAKKLHVPVVMFGGVKFTPGKNGYLRRTKRAGWKEQQLHRVIWQKAHGPIPEGWNVHFKDGNKRNFALENLECAPLAEISSKTATGENGATHARREKLMQSMARFITREANRYAHAFGVTADDLLQVGHLEALKLAKKHDENKGGFYGYSFRQIQRVMRVAAQRSAHSVSVPDARFFDSGISTVSLNAPVGDDPDGQSFADVIASDTCISSEILDNEQSQLLSSAIAELTEREQLVLRARFYEDRTLDDIATELRLSRERIRQIELDAISRLKKNTHVRRLAA